MQILVGMAVLTLAHATRALVPQEGPSDREHAVLAVLGQLNASDAVWPEPTVFEREQDDLGRSHLVSTTFVTCSLSVSLLDAARAKQLARELFAVYGFDAQPDFLLREEGVEVLLDGYDAERKVGFKLRGMLPGNDQYPSWRAVPEPPSTDLTRAELERLEAAGVRLDVADLDRYQGALEDECTPMLAYLSGVVAFLDEVTSGPDIDLRAVLGVSVQKLRIEALDGATGWDELSTWPSFEIASRDPAALCVEWDGIQRIERREDGEFSGWYLPEQLSPTRGAPSRLHVNLVGSHRANAAIRVTQVQADGATLECWSPGTTVLLPSTFDVNLRFNVTLQLDPGKYLCDRWVMIGCREP